MEKLAVFDKDNHVKEGFVIRGEKPKPGDRIKVVIIFIRNSVGKYLVQKTSSAKGSNYTSTGGHVGYGESARDTIVREVQEELGLELTSEVKLLGTITFETRFMDVYYVEQDVDIAALSLQEEEVESVSFMSSEEVMQKINNGEFLASHGRAFVEFLTKK